MLKFCLMGFQYPSLDEPPEWLELYFLFLTSSSSLFFLMCLRLEVWEMEAAEEDAEEEGEEDHSG